MALDVSGIAVGYILDAVFDKMVDAGSRIVLINAGGDIRLGDSPPNSDGWRIDIAGLGKTSPPLAMLKLSNCAITTSGDLNQFIELDGRRYSHFIDPNTGTPIERRQSVTAIAPTTVDADAGATALAVLGMDRACALFSTMPLNQAILIEATNANEPIRLRWLTQD
jgi:FAD:protein FMN transferase